MPNLIIKPQNTSGNKVLIQDQGSVTRLQTDDAGVTITAPTIASMANCTFPVGHVLGCACLVRVNNGADGGSSLTNTLRNLDTVLYEVGFGVTIASNEWTFDDAGSYLIHANVPAYNSTRHISTIYADTGSTLVATGTSEYSNNGEATQTRGFIHTKVVVTEAQKTSGGSEKSFGIYTEVTTAVGGNGLGVDADDSTVEQFTQVQIFKIQE